MDDTRISSSTHILPSISWQEKKKKVCPDKAGCANSITISEYRTAVGCTRRQICPNVGATFAAAAVPLRRRVPCLLWRDLARCNVTKATSTATIHGRMIPANTNPVETASRL